MHSFAISKAKRQTVGRHGGKIVFSPNLSGYVLLQMVHEYVQHYRPVFREGAVDAVVDDFSFSEKLLDTKDGEFNLGEFGKVRFEGPITFRLVLFDPKSRSEATGPEGRAEVAFKKYIAMDRHGAELSGELYGDEDQPGSEDEKNDGKMTLKLKRR